MKYTPFKKPAPKRLKEGKTSIAFVVFEDSMAYAADGWGQNRIHILFCKGVGASLPETTFVETEIMEKAVLPAGVYRADNFDMSPTSQNATGVHIGDWVLRQADDKTRADYATTIDYYRDGA